MHYAIGIIGLGGWTPLSVIANQLGLI